MLHFENQGKNEKTKTPRFFEKGVLAEKLCAHHTLSFHQSLELQAKQGETPESGHSVHALEQAGASLWPALAKFWAASLICLNFFRVCTQCTPALKYWNMALACFHTSICVRCFLCERTSF